MFRTFVVVVCCRGFADLVFYVEACESGSIFEGLLSDDLNIYATTASNAQESSWGTYCPGKEIQCAVHHWPIMKQACPWLCGVGIDFCRHIQPSNLQPHCMPFTSPFGVFALCWDSWGWSFKLYTGEVYDLSHVNTITMSRLRCGYVPEQWRCMIILQNHDQKLKFFSLEGSILRSSCRIFWRSEMVSCWQPVLKIWSWLWYMDAHCRNGS